MKIIDWNLCRIRKVCIRLEFVYLVSLLFFSLNNKSLSTVKAYKGIQRDILVKHQAIQRDSMDTSDTMDTKAYSCQNSPK